MSTSTVAINHSVIVLFNDKKNSVTSNNLRSHSDEDDNYEDITMMKKDPRSP